MPGPETVVEAVYLTADASAAGKGDRPRRHAGGGNIIASSGRCNERRAPIINDVTSGKHHPARQRHGAAPAENCEPTGAATRSPATASTRGFLPADRKNGYAAASVMTTLTTLVEQRWRRRRREEAEAPKSIWIEPPPPPTASTIRRRERRKVQAWHQKSGMMTAGPVRREAKYVLPFSRRRSDRRCLFVADWRARAARIGRALCRHCLLGRKEPISRPSSL